MSRRAIIVAGLGRCGSSLTMQMLARGGVPVLGQFPAYECEETIDRLRRVAWLQENAPGRAVKILDPHRHPLPRDLPALVIWLDRDVDQQAESVLKWADLMEGTGAPTRRARRGMVSILKRDRRLALCALDAPDRPRLTMTFETLIEDPIRAAATIANFLAVNDDPIMNVAKAVTVVRPRAATCYPGLLEDELAAGDANPPCVAIA